MDITKKVIRLIQDKKMNKVNTQEENGSKRIIQYESAQLPTISHDQELIL